MGMTFNHIADLDDGAILAENQQTEMPAILYPAVGEIHELQYDPEDVDGVSWPIFNQAVDLYIKYHHEHFVRFINGGAK
jgi:hypothetical protein